LYSTFIYWALLQEKLTNSTKEDKGYRIRGQDGAETSTASNSLPWDYVFSLNALMALAGYLMATGCEFMSGGSAINVYLIRGKEQKEEEEAAAVAAEPPKCVSLFIFWKASITCALASPLGYASLKYISFPLMVLTKSCKPVPVMMIGLIFYRRSFALLKYLSVLCLSGGIALFNGAKAQKYDSSSSSSSSSSGSSSVNKLSSSSSIHSTDMFVSSLTSSTGMSADGAASIIGIFMVLANLTLDGYTNNEQDMIFAKYKNSKDERFTISSLQMMKYTNLWQVVFICAYLIVGFFAQGDASELSKATYALQMCPELNRDVFYFCLCASIGQVLIFSVMEVCKHYPSHTNTLYKRAQHPTKDTTRSLTYTLIHTHSKQTNKKEFGSLTWITVSITRKLLTVVFSVFINNHDVNNLQWAGIGLVFVGMFLDLILSYQKKEGKEEKKEKKDKKE